MTYLLNITISYLHVEFHILKGEKEVENCGVLNYIWGGMIIIGIVYGSFTGNMAAITEAALDSSKEAVTLCITMMGVMSLWVGLMEIARNAGLVDSMTRIIQPFVSFLCPKLPKNHKAREYISLNIVANILGLGWAATPAGLKAMEALAELEEERNSSLTKSEDSGKNIYGKSNGQINGKVTEKGDNGIKSKPCLDVASNEMCTFLIINISSLQLIPVNIIAYRSQYGSVNPTAVIGPGLMATAISTIIAIIFCKIMTRSRRA